jgi:hypothetical protein
VCVCVCVCVCVSRKTPESGIVKPEVLIIFRQRLVCSCDNEYPRRNIRTAASGVFRAVRVISICSERTVIQLHLLARSQFAS